MYKNILDLFRKTVEEKADKVAVIHNNDSIIFCDLDKKSRYLAKCLLRLQKDTNTAPIAVFLPKSIDVVIADIGVTYSGNFFSNLDIKTPAERIRNILEVMKPGVLITDEKGKPFLDSVASAEVPILLIDKLDWEQNDSNDDALVQIYSKKLIQILYA